MNSLYIHIPFCHNICAYCDFTKKYAQYYDIDKYITYLNKELEMYNINEVKTLYIGGGTPSLLTCEQIKNINIPKVVSEFSFEMNPEDVNFEKLLALKEIGVTRISMGVQTINEDILRENKRNHMLKDIINALELFSDFDFEINLDFMYGFAKETKADILNNLKFIKKHSAIIDHISYYNLILEDNTILDVDNYEIDEKVDQENYYFIINYLEELGYFQYEISNFCKENKTSKHNLVYWKNEKYYAVGCGASGYVGNKRYKNVGSIFRYYEYLDRLEFPYLEVDVVEELDYIYEYIMLGLRLREGIDITKIMNYDVNIERLEVNECKCFIREQDLFISNEIILSVIGKL